MSTPGLVSVVVPCFNSAPFINDALVSLRSQTFSSLEILAVNDGSTDDSLQIIEQHARSDERIRIFSQPNRGLPAARNVGIRHARGEFLCFLDADDVFLPHKIAEQVRFLGASPDVDLVYSDYLVADNALQLTGLVAVRIKGDDLIDAYARRNWFGIMVPLLRRSLITAVGEFDETLRASEDWDYWIRCAKTGVFAYLPGVVAIYRTHESQMHSDRSRMFTAGKQVIEKHFRSDSLRYHRALSAFYDANARYSWASEDRLRAVLFVVLSAYHNKLAPELTRSQTGRLTTCDNTGDTRSRYMRISDEFKRYEQKCD